MIVSDLKTLDDFYSLMYSARDIRRSAMKEMLAGRGSGQGVLEMLREAHAALEALPREGGRSRLHQAGRTVPLDLFYEREELKKDIRYLVGGFEGLVGYLEEKDPKFPADLERVSLFLKDFSPRILISDRDGTVNNYCARYLSSVQSLYNAHSLVRFSALPETALLLTSAPLGEEDGLLRVNTMPPGFFLFAGSKGRECLDREGRRQVFPIPEMQQQALDALNRSLEELLHIPEYRVFSMIGSGFQRKFGQTTIARQDMGGTVNEKTSRLFLQKVEDLVNGHDPKGDTFRIEDTGMDIEIILTLPRNSSDTKDVKDFDKGDGVRFLNERLHLHLNEGQVLVCGDTPSDLAMLEAACALSDRVGAVFVGCEEPLRARVRECCGLSFFVDSPDALVLGMAKACGLF